MLSEQQTYLVEITTVVFRGGGGTLLFVFLYIIPQLKSPGHKAKVSEQLTD